MISVIVPFFNEEENVFLVLKELDYFLSYLNKDYEILAIDDGSKDGTLKVLKDLKKELKNLRVLMAKENGGQSSALWAGICHSKGEIIVTMDGDGQNLPEDITKLLEGLENFDMVIGVRKERRDNFWKKFSSKIANGFRRFVLKDKFQDIGCGLKAFKRKVLKDLPPFKTIHRFLPILVQWQGYKIKEIEVKHRERFGGKSKYGTYKRLIFGLWDLIGMFWLKKRIIKYFLEEISD